MEEVKLDGVSKISFSPYLYLKGNDITSMGYNDYDTLYDIEFPFKWIPSGMQVVFSPIFSVSSDDGSVIDSPEKEEACSDIHVLAVSRHNTDVSCDGIVNDLVIRNVLKDAFDKGILYVFKIVCEKVDDKWNMYVRGSSGQ